MNPLTPNGPIQGEDGQHLLAAVQGTGARHRCQPFPVSACVDIAFTLGHSAARRRHGWLDFTECILRVAAWPTAAIRWALCFSTPSLGRHAQHRVSSNPTTGRLWLRQDWLLAGPRCLRCPKFFENDPIPTISTSTTLPISSCLLASYLKCILDASPTMSSFRETSHHHPP